MLFAGSALLAGYIGWEKHSRNVDANREEQKMSASAPVASDIFDSACEVGDQTRIDSLWIRYVNDHLSSH